MKRMGTALLSAAGLLAAGTVAADVGGSPAAAPQWTYLQVGWYQGDGFKDEGRADGGEIAGSIGFLNNWHAGLAYVDGEYDYGSSDDKIDFDGYRLWAGYHQAITSSGNTQLVGDILYYDIDYDGGEGGYKADNKGYGVKFGARTIIGNIELEGGLAYTRGEYKERFFSGTEKFKYTDTVFQIGGRYHWTNAISTGLLATINDASVGSFGYMGGDSVVLDFRWSFGNNVDDSF